MSVEIRITPIERYQVTRYSPVTGSQQVATDLTLEQARDIAGAIHARAEMEGKAVSPVAETQQPETVSD